MLLLSAGKCTILLLLLSIQFCIVELVSGSTCCLHGGTWPPVCCVAQHGVCCMWCCIDQAVQVCVHVLWLGRGPEH
jgi:hypothetical protein